MPFEFCSTEFIACPWQVIICRGAYLTTQRGGKGQAPGGPFGLLAPILGTSPLVKQALRCVVNHLFLAAQCYVHIALEHVR